jgi:hypothetical protein
MCLPVTPFKVEREWKHAGLSCAVVLAKEAGHRCGYVRVPPGHPMHGKRYDDVNVEIHGGLTFADLEPCTEHEDGQGYWFGFDCAHCYDASYDPNAKIEDMTTDEGKALLRIHREMDLKYPMPERERYWTELEVVAETERLAEQLASITADCG